MSKSLPPLEVGQRGYGCPRDLSLHHLSADLPMQDRVIQQIALSVPDKGIIAELLITPDREIADGRHRWKGAIRAGMATKPCLPYRVVDPDDVPDIILMSVAERYDLSKGAKVYMLLPMVERAIAEGIERRSQNLKKGQVPENQLSWFSEKKGLEKLAEELNCNIETIRLAGKTAQLFKQSDARISRWLEDNVDWLSEWEAWREDPTSGSRADDEGFKGGPWTCWRAFRLKDMGHDPEDAKCAAIIPEDYREIYETKLFSVEPGESMGLGAINKAVGSALATKGGERSDLSDKNPALHVTLGNKLNSFTKTMFGKWSDLAVDHRITLARDIATKAAEWPDEVKAAVVAKLKGGAKP